MLSYVSTSWILIICREETSKYCLHLNTGLSIMSLEINMSFFLLEFKDGVLFNINSLWQLTSTNKYRHTSKEIKCNEES